MNHRLTTVVLAAATFGGVALDQTLRTAPILAVLGAVFVAAIAWPTARLRELTLAVTVGVGCLGSLSYGLFATLVALAVLATSEFGTTAAGQGSSAVRRTLAMVVVMIGLVIAVGVGDQRINPDSDASASARDSGPASGTDRDGVNVVIGNSPIGRNLTIDNITPDDAQRVAIEATLANSEYQIRADYILGDQLDAGVQLSGSETHTDPTDRLPWLLALVALLVGAYSLIASRRFGDTPITIESSNGSPSTATPLDWYDRIAEAAGHPRHHADPVLSHSRRVAGETGDERFRELGRIVSDHVYSGRPLTDDDLELIRELRHSD